MRNWKLWWEAASIRAIKTVAEAAIGIIGSSAAISEIDWKVVVSSCVIAGVSSLLWSIRGLPEITLNESNSISDESIDSKDNGVG